MSSTLVLGIHIGDTTCSVAVHRQGIIDVVANEQGSRVTPAVVAFTDVETLLGEPARAQLVRNAANTVTNGMRLLGRKFDEEAFQEELATWKFRVTKGKDGSTPQIDVSVKGAQKSFTPSRLLSLLLERLRADAVASTGEEVKEATVALPEYFDAAQRAALKEAAQTGGIRVKTMLSAPLCVALLHGSGDAAAAAAPAAGGVERARQYLVVDLGGTSCEACVVEHAPRHPAVADSLTADEISKDRVVPHPDRIRDVSLNVATAICLESQKLGLANISLGTTSAEVRSALEKLMWSPFAA